MAWKEEGVTEKNFSEEEFTIIRQAVDMDLVTWGKVSEFAGYCNAEFKFLGHTYEMNEEFELVTSIYKRENKDERKI